MAGNVTVGGSHEITGISLSRDIKRVYPTEPHRTGKIIVFFYTESLENRFYFSLAAGKIIVFFNTEPLETRAQRWSTTITCNVGMASNVTVG